MKFEEIIEQLKKGIETSDLDEANKHSARLFIKKLVREHKAQPRR